MQCVQGLVFLRIINSKHSELSIYYNRAVFNNFNMFLKNCKNVIGAQNMLNMYFQPHIACIFNKEADGSQGNLLKKARFKVYIELNRKEHDFDYNRICI